MKQTDLSPIQSKAFAELKALGIDKSFILEAIADQEPLLLNYEGRIEAIYLDYRAGLTI